MGKESGDVDVFISYQRGERDAVAIIAQRLIELRVAVWFDRALRPGGAFDEEIASKLGAARAVLTCWTPSAMASDWVRAEAAMARQSDKLVACILEPVQLMPPFNVIHAEDLSAWAGQDDDPAWLKLLDRIGELLGRPGLARYAEVMRTGATLDTLRQWALDNGDDPLVDTVWHRIHQLEGEDQAGRIEREKTEAAAAAQRRRAQTERSRELAKARGLRSGHFDRAIARRLVYAVGVLTLVVLLAGAYLLDKERRQRSLDAATTPEVLAAFIADNHWHPISTEARRRFDLLDATAWSEARTVGSLPAIESYLKRFSGHPAGAHLPDAQGAREQALARREVQRRLSRLGLYVGAQDGAAAAELRQAIEEIQYNARLQVTGEPDERLLSALDQRIAARVATTPDQLKAVRTGPPTIDDYRRIAARLRVDALVLPAIQAVESKARGFDAAGRPLIRFETHIFSRQTRGRFDASSPDLSSRRVAAGQGQAEDWRRLRAAFALAPQEAYASTSFGMFGVMGFHAQRLGFQTPAELARFQSESEANQVEVFARFVESAPERFLDALRTPGWNGFEPASWEAFARSYNGPMYARLRYHEKLALAYRRAAADFGIEVPDGLAPIADVAALQPQPKAGGKGKSIKLPALGETEPAPWGWALVLAALALGSAAWSRSSADPIDCVAALVARRRRRRVAAVAAVGLLAGALIPPEAMPFPTTGPTVHVLGFALLAALVQAAGLAPRRVAVCALLWITCALGVETAQALFTSDRIASPTDALASALGALAGILAMRLRGCRSFPLAAAVLSMLAPAAIASIAALRPLMTDLLLQRAWTEAQSQQAPRRPWPGAPARAVLALDLPGSTRPIVVVDSDRSAALALAPGISTEGGGLTGGALVLILGHRNTEFAALDALVEGQRFTTRSADGVTRRYIVSRREIVRWDQTGLVADDPASARDELALATCWPVGGRAPTPLRLLLRALPEDG